MGIREKGEYRNNGRVHFQWRVPQKTIPLISTFSELRPRIGGPRAQHERLRLGIQTVRVAK